MQSMFLWIYRLIILLVAMLGLGTLVVYFFFSRSLPEYSGENHIEGLAGEVRIVRDAFNVPHIFAKTPEDALVAMGYVHAQDRLWQMLILRRKAQGRMSEALGPAYLKADRKARQIGFMRLARQGYDALSADQRRELTKYAEGVNAYLLKLQNEARGRGAPEFFFFKPNVEPWAPADALAFSLYLNWQSNPYFDAEILEARTQLALGKDLSKELTGALIEAASDNRFGAKIAADLRQTSNIVAATGTKTASGQTLIGIDLHEELNMPGPRYLMALHLPNTKVLGVTQAGIPSFQAGISPSRVWAFLPLLQDTIDIGFIDEALLEEAQRDSILIHQDGTLSDELTLRFLNNRPVLDPEDFDLAQITPSGFAPVLHWSEQHHLGRAIFNDRRFLWGETDEVYGNFRLLNADKDTVTFQASPPSFERIAGIKGNIPAFLRGFKSLWVAREASLMEDLARGPLIASADRSIHGEAAQIHNLMAPPHRQRRMERLLTSREVHSLQSFMDLLTDDVSEAARATLPLIARNLWFSEDTKSESELRELRNSALQLLTSWNGEMSEHLPQPLIYTTWIEALHHQMVRDELGELQVFYQTPRHSLIQRAFLDIEGASHWCDIKPSDVIESCDEIASRSLNIALTRLANEFGGNPESWIWSDHNRALLSHEFLGRISWLNWFTDLLQPLSGGNETIKRVRANFGRLGGPQAIGSSFRILVDFADPGNSRVISSTGQSGHFLSPFYEDLTRLWRRDEYIPVVFEVPFLESTKTAELLLKPK